MIFVAGPREEVRGYRNYLLYAKKVKFPTFGGDCSADLRRHEIGRLRLSWDESGRSFGSESTLPKHLVVPQFESRGATRNGGQRYGARGSPEWAVASEIWKEWQITTLNV